MKYSHFDIAIRDSRRMMQSVEDIATVSEKLGDGIMGFDHAGSWTSKAVGLALTSAAGTATLNRLIEFYQHFGAPARIQTSPYSDPSLYEHLATLNFRIIDWDSVFFWNLAETHPPKDRDSRHFEYVDLNSSDALKDAFVQSHVRGFQNGDTPTQEDVQLAHRMVNHPRVECLSIWEEGVCVATAGNEYFEDSVTLIAGSVLPEFRNQGLQTAMIRKRIARAKERGLHYAVVASVPGGPTERNASRLGARLAYQQPLFERAFDHIS